MGSTTPQLLPEQTVRVIGPQIGLCNKEGVILITIALPHLLLLQRLTCVLLTNSGAEQDRRTETPRDSRFKNFIFEFESIQPDKIYRYKFLDEQGSEVSLEGNLSYPDCWFYGPSFNNETDKFVLLSCNNPFESGLTQRSEQFAMWKRLNERIASNQDIRLIMQGGDQVYHDRIEINSLKALLGKTDNQESLQQVTEQVIRNYQDFYSDLDYRKILARIPSVAMLDDHDITDGWGGRLDSFDEKNEFQEHWKYYRDIAYDAFKAFQACKNPKPLVNEAATTFLDAGCYRFYLLDLRAEKNINKDILLSPAHKASLLNSLQSLPEKIKRVFVLSPVVPVRINPALEEILAESAIATYKLKIELEKQSGMPEVDLETNWFESVWIWIKNIFVKLMKKNPYDTYADDLTDGLTAKVNKPFLLDLLRTLSSISVEGTVLSGDIHTSGITELFIKSRQGVKTIPQIVSSPIGYEPMQKLVKDGTTEEADIILSENENEKIWARNIFYRADRCFAIITPGKLRESEGIEFHFEHLVEPLFSPAYFSKT